MSLITAHASEASAPRSTYSVKGPVAVGFVRCSLFHFWGDAEGLCGGDSARAWGSLGRLEAEPDGSHFFLPRAKGACFPSTRCIDGSRFARGPVGRPASAVARRAVAGRRDRERW